MSDPPICYPAQEPGLSVSRINILTAIDLLGDAQAQLRTAFPAGWTGPGANACTTAVLGLLHHAQGIDRALRAAERTVVRLDAELAAYRAGGTG
ncbi:hypothetical protein KZX45_11990 [Georgenia sp. EYE_87]|uniref:hypothetical protein n=1 Tax=Georgenia sp. EYE_87 TaxID=2853448 RepID=UPI002005CBD1|nr:hypothetical protein [Georgenia sp. EYE_87]MCK6211264.1 hypothetical protein [Georgenia sp. EYE_87]